MADLLKRLLLRAEQMFETTYTVARCAHDHHPDRPHFHWGYGQRQYEFGRPGSGMPFANRDAMHGKGRYVGSTVPWRSKP